MYLEEINFNSNSPLNIEIQSIEKYPLHYHNDITEIILPIKGKIKIKAGFEEVLLEDGNFFFINNNLIHSISSDEKALVILFHVNLDYFIGQFPYIKYMFFRNSLSSKFHENTEYYPSVDETFKRFFLKNLLEIIFETEKNSTSYFNLNKLIHRLVYQMIYKFTYLQLLKRDVEFIPSHQLNRYYRIVEYISNNYKDRIYLDDIVSLEFLSKNYFSSNWKNLTGFTFQENIDFIRVTKSEALLLNNMTLTEISQQCGFSDIKYYYKNFKKWYGYMPLEFKEKCNIYESRNNKFEVLSFRQIKSELESYSSRFFNESEGSIEEIHLSNILDTYFNLKYSHTISKQKQSNNTRYG